MVENLTPSSKSGPKSDPGISRIWRPPDFGKSGPGAEIFSGIPIGRIGRFLNLGPGSFSLTTGVRDPDLDP